MTRDRPSGTAASARRLGKRFPPDRTALTEVDLDLPFGAVSALVGPNGAGKTTLLRILGGLLAPETGEVEVLGSGRPAEQRRKLAARISYVPQDVALDPLMTGAETLSLFAALHGLPGAERKRRSAALARSFGLGRHCERPVASWSGGLKRRLHLALGMIHDPDLMLFDEPTAGLDLAGCDLLWAELGRRAAAGCAVAVVTHDLAAVERHADRVAVLQDGRLVAAGSPGELAERDGGLVEAYRRLTGREPEPPRAGRRER